MINLKSISFTHQIFTKYLLYVMYNSRRQRHCNDPKQQQQKICPMGDKEQIILGEKCIRKKYSINLKNKYLYLLCLATTHLHM